MKARRTTLALALPDEKIEEAIRDAEYLLFSIPTTPWMGIEDEDEERDYLRMLVWLTVRNIVYHHSQAREWCGLPLPWDDHLTDPHERRRYLIEIAHSGSQPVHDALCHVAERLTSESEPVPAWLRDYVFGTVRHGRPRRGRGRTRADNWRRDQAITRVVFVVAVRYGLKATRNPATAESAATESACSIVAKAIERLYVNSMTEANVNRIWGGGDGHILLNQERPAALDHWIRSAPMGKIYYRMKEEFARCEIPRPGFESRIRSTFWP